METVCDGRAYQPDNNGMSLRDYFAARALSGMLARNGRYPDMAQVANACYALADAMMKRREE